MNRFLTDEPAFNKALQTESSCHASCIRKSRASLPLPLSLVVRRQLAEM